MGSKKLAVKVVGTVFDSLDLSNVKNEPALDFDGVKVPGVASFSSIGLLGNARLRNSVFGNELIINPGATAGDVELTDVSLAQAELKLPEVKSVRLKGVRIKKRLRLGLK